MCVSCQNLCVLSKFTFFGYNWLSHSQFCFLWFVVKSGHFRFPFAGRAFLRGPLLIGLISWNKGTDKWVSYCKQPEYSASCVLNSKIICSFVDFNINTLLYFTGIMVSWFSVLQNLKPTNAVSICLIVLLYYLLTEVENCF